MKRLWRKIKCWFGFHVYETRKGLRHGFLDGFCEWDECVYCKHEKD